MNSYKEIIILEVENDLFYRGWELGRSDKGYVVTVVDSTRDVRESVYISTKSALEYIKQAQEGTLPVPILCFGASYPTRNSAGVWYSSDWIR